MRKNAILAALIIMQFISLSCATVYVVRHATVESIIAKGDEALANRYRIKGWVVSGFEGPTAIYDTRDNAENEKKGTGILVAGGYFDDDPFIPERRIYKVDIEGTVHFMENREIGPGLRWPAALFNISTHKSEQVD